MSFAIDDVVLIRASTRSEEFQWQGSEGEIDRFESILTLCEEGTSAKDVIADNNDVKKLAYRIRISPELWLDVKVNLITDEYQPQIGLHGPSLAKEEWEKIKGMLNHLYDKAKEEKIDHIVFDVYTELQSQVVSMIPPEVDHTSQLSSNHFTAIESKSDQPKEVKMLRVIFWTHHLKAPSKKREMNKWCSELQIFGLVKSGYPGFLCFEGIQEDVEEVVKRIKSLQWHAITVKTETPYTVQVESNLGFENESGSKENLYSLAIRQSKLARNHSANGKSTASDVVRTSMDEVETSGELVQR